MSGALSHIRICDLTGQLAGAGATRTLAAFGAQVIRVEDPVRQGRWDILRGQPPYVDERQGLELGGAYNNHNVQKLGVTLNLRTERAKQLLAQLIAVSDVVTENFSAGVLTRLGFSYDELREIKPDIILVSNCGFGNTGPLRDFRTWGPMVQACSGLTFATGLPDHEPSGWGYSYMDHQGANFMAVAVLAALCERDRTGNGCWIDMACTEAGTTLLGPAVLDATVNGRGMAGREMNTNHSLSPRMVPHNIYAAEGDDNWVALACRDDDDWAALVSVIGEPWIKDPRFVDVAGRGANEADLDQLIGSWTAERDRHTIAEALQAAGVPAVSVARPEERIDHDQNTAAWGLWPEVTHPEIGRVRVDGIPVHLSETDWVIDRGAPLLGEHNKEVFGDLLGVSDDELEELHLEGIL